MSTLLGSTYTSLFGACQTAATHATYCKKQFVNNVYNPIGTKVEFVAKNLYDPFTSLLKKLRTYDGLDKAGSFAVPLCALVILVRGDNTPKAVEKISSIFENYKDFYEGTQCINVSHELRAKPFTSSKKTNFENLLAVAKRVMAIGVAILSANDFIGDLSLPSFAKTFQLFKDITWSVGNNAAGVSAIPVKLALIILMSAMSVYENLNGFYATYQKSQSMEKKITLLNDSCGNSEEIVARKEVLRGKIRGRINRIEKAIKGENFGDAKYAAEIIETLKSIKSEIKDETVIYVTLLRRAASLKELEKAVNDPNGNKAGSCEIAEAILGAKRLIGMANKSFEHQKLNVQYKEKAAKHQFEYIDNSLKLGANIFRIISLSLVTGKIWLGLEVMKKFCHSASIAKAVGVESKLVYDFGLQAIKLVGATFGITNFLFFNEEPKVTRPVGFFPNACE